MRTSGAFLRARVGEEMDPPPSVVLKLLLGYLQLVLLTVREERPWNELTIEHLRTSKLSQDGRVLYRANADIQLKQFFAPIPHNTPLRCLCSLPVLGAWNELPASASSPHI